MHFCMALAGCIVFLGFKLHFQCQGYGTEAHMQAIRDHGVCIEHRKSFAPIRWVMVGHGGPSRSAPWWRSLWLLRSLRGKPWRSKATSRFGNPERKPWWMQWCSDAVQMYLVNIYSESRALKSLKSGFSMIFPYHQDISRLQWLHHVTRVTCHWGFWSSHQCHQCHQSLGDGKVITAVILSNGSNGFPGFCRVVT